MPVKKRKAKSVTPKCTMTLNLTEPEMKVLEELTRKKDLSKTSVVRQALRLYLFVDVRLSNGERLFFKNGNEESEVMVL